MTYQEVLDYLYSQLPMYQRQGSTAFKKDLSNTLALCDFLGNPQQKIRSIHIAGTNGKGSTAHSLASVLQQAGYKTGLYTSPHLKDYRERIRINGEMISEEAVIAFVEKIKTKVSEILPSFFEMTVAMAFDHFANEQVDIAVIETGLGGRLDSTNVLIPVLSVITSIGLDHTKFLGDTLEAIAGEKAGIIKQGVPVVLPKHLPGKTREVFMNYAAQSNSRVNDEAVQYNCQYEGDEILVLKNDTDLQIRFIPDIKGFHYLRNLPTVLESVEELRKAGFAIEKKQIIGGLSGIGLNTGLKGRWQKLGDRPTVITDVGHNVDGWTEILNQLSQIDHRQLHIVLGMVDDKDTDELFDLLPSDAIYYLCEMKIPRAMPLATLAEKARQAGFTYSAIGDVNECIAKARELATDNDLIFIGGSTFVVAEIKDL